MGRPARKLTYNGETKTLDEWAAALGIAKDTIRGRLDKGWPIWMVVTTPALTKRKARPHCAGCLYYKRLSAYRPERYCAFILTEMKKRPWAFAECPGPFKEKQRRKKS